MLRMPDPNRMLISNELVSAIPHYPEKADDQQSKPEDSHGARGVAERRGERWRRAPSARLAKPVPPAAIRSTEKFGALVSTPIGVEGEKHVTPSGQEHQKEADAQ
jgi:hypothetical protein